MIIPKLIILCGIPGSGKSTYAKDYIAENKNTVHLSSDGIRSELWGDESIQGNPAEVFALMQKRAVDALNDGKNVIYDCTSMTRKDRQGIIGVCPKFARIECHIVWAPIEVCIERDIARNRTVGKEIIDRMLKRFQAPFFDEGFNDIKIIKTVGIIPAHYEQKCWEDMNIEHDNPHHQLGVQAHCEEAHRQIEKHISNFEMEIATWYHDIGKPYVKSFTDSKGNACEYAHYYQHQCVGSWMSYGFASPYVAWLISTHMEPFFNSKYYNNLPTFLKKDIDLLHEADLNAH